MYMIKYFQSFPLSDTTTLVQGDQTLMKLRLLLHLVQIKPLLLLLLLHHHHHQSSWLPEFVAEFVPASYKASLK